MHLQSQVFVAKIKGNVLLRMFVVSIEIFPDKKIDLDLCKLSGKVRKTNGVAVYVVMDL